MSADVEGKDFSKEISADGVGNCCAQIRWA